MLRLVTIPISHYCEKARWALDRAELPYREERHVQILHVFAARLAGGGTTTPVLVTPERAIGSSQEIVAWADHRMRPERRVFPDAPVARDEVERLCRRFDEGLGVWARRIIYVLMLPEPELMLRFNNQGVPRWEDRLLRRAFGPATDGIRRVLDIRPGVEVQDEADVWREFDAVAGLLADGRPYLCGERFSAADLAFAALSAPVLAPPGYGVELPALGELDPRTVDLIRRAREHPAGRFALAMYATQRDARTAVR